MSQPSIELKKGLLRLCVNPALGGRLTEFSYAGKNALHATGPVTGSTFWPSPQSTWDWPPLEALDSALYQYNVDQNQAILTSPVCQQTQLQLIKQLTLLNDRLEIVYTMINAGDVEVQFAPWEITRVGGGKTFFKSAQPALANSTGVLDQKEGYAWHEYDVSRQAGNQKIFANGSAGWLANAHNGLLLLKTFAPVDESQIAPGEAEIEIYGHGDANNPYIEVEQQGAYQVIPPGGEIRWPVTWYLVDLPAQEDDEQMFVNAVKNILSKINKSD